MSERNVNQYGNQSIYIETNTGSVYLNDYVASTEEAFRNISYDLDEINPTIQPEIQREEVNMLYEWIMKKDDPFAPDRVALLYGDAGIGKTIVMKKISEQLRNNPTIIYLGLKSDQVTFIDMEDLRKKMNLAKPLFDIIRELSKKGKKTVLLIDQIDALSWSLAHNRTPLRSLLQLINQVKEFPNVRIIISCRPYDLEYDPILKGIKCRNKIHLNGLTEDQVKSILKSNSITDELTSNMASFLSNPLHLFLFLKVRNSGIQITLPVTEESLYGSLWKSYIVYADTNHVDREKLITLLDKMVEKMHKDQVFMLNKTLFETDYTEELNYLLSAGLVNLIDDNKVKFIHQTMYDYVFARRFVEKGNNLLDLIGGTHQGLFLRSTVKSIMSFERSVDETQYFRTLKQILFDKTNNGGSKYRFHLKSLLLSMIPFYEKPLEEEIDLIKSKVYFDKDLFNTFLNSVYNKKWFVIVEGLIRNGKNWNELSPINKNQILSLCHHFINSDGDFVIDYLSETVLKNTNNAERELILRLINNINLKCSSTKLLYVYKQLRGNIINLDLAYCLGNLVKDYPEFVVEELICYFIAIFNNKGQNSQHQSSYQIEIIFNNIKDYHPDKILEFNKRILEKIYDNISFEMENYTIKYSHDFLSFERVHGHSYNIGQVNDLVNSFLDEIEEKNKQGEDLSKLFLDMSSSKYDGLIYISLYGYSLNPERFKNEIFDLFSRRTLLCNAPANVEYQAKILFSKVFCYWTKVQKDVAIEKVINLDSDLEKEFYFKKRISLDYPITNIGRHKGEILKSIETYLYPDYKEAYKLLNELKRRFNNRLDITPPFKSSLSIGHPSMKKEKVSKMSNDDWVKSMRKYNTDSGHNWSAPSLSGQKERFADEVINNPSRFIPFIKVIINDQSIPIDYPIAGLIALSKTDYLDDVEVIFSSVACLLKNGKVTSKYETNIFGLFHTVENVMNKGKLPRCMFCFICDILKNYPEVEEDPKFEKDLYQKAINTVRGHAGYILVNSTHFKEQYGEEIISVIESIALSASATTRAAILLNMALLNNIDKDKNVELFKLLLHDYNPSLMALPVHNFNPLVYFVNYAFDGLVSYFEKGLEIPESYESNIQILFLAWQYTDKVVCKKYIDIICSKNESARIALVRFLGISLDIVSIDKAFNCLLDLLDDKYVSKDLSSQYDFLFHKIDAWNDFYKNTFVDSFLKSKLSLFNLHSIFDFLARNAIKDPIKTLEWIDKLVQNNDNSDSFFWHQIIDIIIQSYNGIKKLDDDSTIPIMDKALDLIDKLMRDSAYSMQLLYFLNKLDND